MKVLLALAVTALLACTSNDPVTCAVNSDCVQGGVTGVCLVSTESSSKFCAFADSACADGFRWGLLAGDGLAKECVEEGGGGPDAGVDAGPAELTVTLAGEGSGTVQSDPAGIDCSATCTHEFSPGAAVSLTATPSQTSFFDGWSGACSGDGSCELDLNGPAAVTATFAKTGNNRWVQQLGSTNGIVMTAAATPGQDVVVAGVGAIDSVSGIVVSLRDGSSGDPKWTKVFATGLGLTRVSSLVVNGSGDVFVAGIMEVAIDFDGILAESTGGGGTLGSAGTAFVARLSGIDGHAVWALGFGHCDYYGHEPHRLALDGGGNVFIAGPYTASFSLAGAALSVSGGQDIYLARFSAAGVPIWAKRIGGTGFEQASGLAINGNGDIDIAGDFGGQIVFDTAAITAHGTGNSRDVFLATYSTTDGSHIDHATFGQAGNERLADLSVNPVDGSVVLSGTYDGALTIGGTTMTGTKGLFVLTVGATGTQKAFGIESASAIATDVAVDDAGQRIWLVGSFAGEATFGGNTTLVSSGGSKDGFVAAYTLDGSHIFSARLGGPDGEGAAMVVALQKKIVVGGDFRDTADFGDATLSSVDNYDGFVWSIVP